MLPWKRAGACGTQAICARQASAIGGGEVGLIDEHTAVIGADKAQQQGGDGAFARAAGADEGHRLARPDGQGDVIQGGMLAAGVGDSDVVEGEGGGQMRRGGGA